MLSDVLKKDFRGTEEDVERGGSYVFGLYDEPGMGAVWGDVEVRVGGSVVLKLTHLSTDQAIRAVRAIRGDEGYQG